MTLCGEALKTVSATLPSVVEVLANKTRQEKKMILKVCKRERKLFSVEANMADHRAHSGKVRTLPTRERAQSNG